jgi:mitogen-activated protein kinase kinase
LGALQIIHVEAKKEMRRRIVRELQIMHDTNSEYIVNFYGAFLSDTNDVIMCMEYMDVGYGLEMEIEPVLTIP